MEYSTKYGEYNSYSHNDVPGTYLQNARRLTKSFYLPQLDNGIVHVWTRPHTATNHKYDTKTNWFHAAFSSKARNAYMALDDIAKPSAMATMLWLQRLSSSKKEMTDVHATEFS